MIQKVKTAVLYLLGIITLLNQMLSIYVILILLGIITKTWLTLTIIGMVWTSLELWKHNYFTKQGMKAKFGRYEIEEE